MGLSHFSTVTETPGLKASAEQMAMLYSRYKFASQFCTGREVLEAACGAGLGLGFLEKCSKRVVGGDIDDDNLHYARRQYQGRSVEIERLDALRLPFADESFDTVLLFEALYYLKDAEQFFKECRRVLRDRGTLVVGTVNREWPGFNPSPFSTRYLSARELFESMREHGFATDLYGAFPDRQTTVPEKITTFLRRRAVRLRLIPRTMKGKEFLKSIFYGKLSAIPPEVEEGMAPYVCPSPISEGHFPHSFKIIYAVGRAQKAVRIPHLEEAIQS